MMCTFSLHARLLQLSFAFALGGLIVAPVLAFETNANDDQKQLDLRDRQSNDAKTAAQLIAEALNHEIYGRQAEGRQCLNEAKKIDQGNPHIQWRLGKIFANGKWQNLDDVAQANRNDKVLANYRQRRATLRNTEAGHFQMAQWCAENGLKDQCRVHLEQVLEFNSNHRQARAALGHQRINSRWFTSAEIDNARLKFALDQKRLEVWKDDLIKLGRLLATRSKVSFKQASRKLAAIDDPSAIVPIETILARQSVEFDKLIVDHIATMDSLDAADSLCRFSVFHPNRNMREHAANQLQDRDLHDYVPQMLASMVTPYISRFSVASNNRGQIVYRHTLFRQGQQKNQAHDYNRLFEAAQRGENATNEIRRQATEQIRQELNRINMVQASENLRANLLNQRICSALRSATGQELGDDPRQWWAWWNNYNEVFYASAKPVDIDRRSRRSIIVNENTPRVTGAVGTQSPRPYECLVAGTLIETEIGPVAIEKILMGDRVLTKNINTGELVYKPVLRPTVRPITELFEIDLGEETIKASGGHPFWVSGQGWVKARELDSGMPIHTVDGVVTVKSVKAQGREVTYNLIVADNSNYFVGKSKILSHDNSIREATQVVVPGLKE